MTDFSVLDALQFGWRDGLEILLVAALLYRALRLVRDARMRQLLIGVSIAIAVYVTAWVLDLALLTWLVRLVLTYGAFALVVIFQPELRAMLARLGHSPAARLLRRLDDGPVEDEIADAVDRLSRSGIGAIIAIEQHDPLTAYIESGSAMQARLSADLLTTIFTPYSPLHDGAVIVRGSSIIGASCILPLSQAILSDRSAGTRHRAALGLSEETDALVIVVSEETASVSVAQGGTLVQQLTTLQLRDMLAGRMPRTSAEYTLARQG